ncbi:hypothetical protein HID58_021963 [Brassica napus]|uniref:Uncharacterized protein n=1 Tax=Brassica napus TaxID=3708 RepID=A0ABQ8CXV2_BRANA|nr:hypothetical protein HID58_021963 [Brassica napus]
MVKDFGSSSLIYIKEVLLRSQTKMMGVSRYRLICSHQHDNVVANIKLRRARHQTIRYNTTDDDPPLTHVVPPISQPNIRFRNVILLSPPHFLQRTHKEETARLPSSCVLSRDELHRRSRDELLLRVRGAPLALIHVSSSDPLPHLSIKNTPIETSSAQFIRQRYTAASSGQKLQNSITNAYGEAQDDHF